MYDIKTYGRFRAAHLTRDSIVSLDLAFCIITLRYFRNLISKFD